MQRILFVLAPVESRWSEITLPYEVLSRAGIEIDFVGASDQAVVLAEALAIQGSEHFLSKLDSILRPDQVVTHQYQGIYFHTGCGPHFGLPENEKVSHIAAKIYAEGGIVAALCQGVESWAHERSAGVTVSGRVITGWSPLNAKAVGE